MIEEMTVMESPAPVQRLSPAVFHEADRAAVSVDPTAYFTYLDLLGEDGVAYARAGELNAALAVRDQVRHAEYTDPADEIGLAIMDARLADGEIAAGKAAFIGISPNMRPWAVIKMLKHGVQPRAWQTATYRLDDAWHQYNLRQQGEIVQDLLATGEYDTALHFAGLMAPEDSMPEERRAQRQTTAIIDVAHHQALHGGDTQAAINTLHELKLQAENQLNTLIEERMRLPEYASNEEEAALLAETQARYEKHLETYNLCDMHVIALRARQSAKLGEQLLQRSAFYGDDHNREYRTLAEDVLAGMSAGTVAAPRSTEKTPDESGWLHRAGTVALRGLRVMASRLRGRRGA